MNHEKKFMTEEDRWQGVAGRDPESDGRFVYAVVTTGVYCRPTCSSRRPLRGNVLFFDSWREAEQSGFRACLRCHPASENTSVALPGAVLRACRAIDEAEEPLSLEQLAGVAGISRYHLHRLFKSSLGVTPKEYASERRARRLQQGLQQGESVSGAMYGAGFGSSSRLYEGSDRLLGMSPGRYRKGGEGERVRWTIAGSTLGHLLVAATDRGICAIELADTPEMLRERLAELFPNAELAGDDPGFDLLVSQVVALVEMPSRTAEFPLDLRGTAFQHRVWKALREIPAGATASYAEVARAIGSPQGARAVARACAANPVAVVIPCHRVTRGDGATGGYRWGAGRKKTLLEREKKKG